MRENTNFNQSMSAQGQLANGIRAGLGLRGGWDVVCRDKHGRVKWRDRIENLVTNGGEDYMLDVGLSGAAATTAWFIGLTDGAPTVAETDTLATHAGWVEVTAYTGTNRLAWTDGGVTGQSVDNVGNEAVFTINADSTVVGGALLCATQVRATTTGLMYAVGAFAGGDRNVDNLDTLTITATMTAGGA